MAQMSYEEFLKMNSNSSGNGSSQGARSDNVHYFFLADDGDTAIVRFDIADINDLVVHSRHSVTVNGKRRSVECLRGYNDPIDSCPLCVEGNKPAYRIYIPLIRYSTDNGRIVAESCIWDQPARFRETLKSYFMDYGDLRNALFKLTRHGRKGEASTTYTLIVANPQMYRNEDYPADFTVLDSLDLYRGILLSKSKEDMQKYIETGDFPRPSPQSNPQSGAQPNSATPRMDKATFTQPQVNNNPTQTFEQRGTVQPSEPIRTTIRDTQVNNPSDGNAQPASHGPRRYVY